MLKSRTVVIVSVTTILGLGVASCAGTSDSIVNESNGGTNSGGGAAFTIVAQPDDKGQAVLNAIASAKVSIDIPIYTIGGDPTFDAALATAKSNGVNVRIMMNGGYGSNPAVATVYSNTLTAAPGAGSVKVNWSSNNFSITHQKSVIVDAVDAQGIPLASGSLPKSASVVISTGNFSGSVQYKETFYQARDYEMTTSDPSTIATIENVFSSDFSCAGSKTIDPGGIAASDQLQWSNGTTGSATGLDGQYPALGNYPAPSGLPSGAIDQGNVKAAYLALIASAKEGDVLRVTNEEMADPDIITALTAASASKVTVRVVMTMPNTKTASGLAAIAALKGIAAAGPNSSVHLFANASGVLYIHSKFVSLNGTQAIVGSQNFSQTSLQYNRELGVQLGSADAAAIAVLTSTFDTDYAVTANVTPYGPGTTGNLAPFKPLTEAQKQALSTVDLPTAYTPNQTCGPVVPLTTTAEAN